MKTKEILEAAFLLVILIDLGCKKSDPSTASALLLPKVRMDIVGSESGEKASISYVKNNVRHFLTLTDTLGNTDTSINAGSFFSSEKLVNLSMDSSVHHYNLSFSLNGKLESSNELVIAISGNEKITPNNSFPLHLDTLLINKQPLPVDTLATWKLIGDGAPYPVGQLNWHVSGGQIFLLYKKA